MATPVLIPTALRAFADAQTRVEVEGRTVGEVLANLAARYSELRRHLYADDGRLRSFVNVYVNDEDIRALARDATPVGPGDTISIVPAIAGGKAAR